MRYADQDPKDPAETRQNLSMHTRRAGEMTFSFQYWQLEKKKLDLKAWNLGNKHTAVLKARRLGRERRKERLEVLAKKL